MAVNPNPWPPDSSPSALFPTLSFIMPTYTTQHPSVPRTAAARPATLAHPSPRRHHNAALRDVRERMNEWEDDVAQHGGTLFPSPTAHVRQALPAPLKVTGEPCSEWANDMLSPTGPYDPWMVPLGGAVVPGSQAVLVTESQAVLPLPMPLQVTGEPWSEWAIDMLSPSVPYDRWPVLLGGPAVPGSHTVLAYPRYEDRGDFSPETESILVLSAPQQTVSLDAVADPNNDPYTQLREYYLKYVFPPSNALGLSVDDTNELQDDDAQDAAAALVGLSQQYTPSETDFIMDPSRAVTETIFAEPIEELQDGEVQDAATALMGLSQQHAPSETDFIMDPSRAVPAIFVEPNATPTFTPERSPLFTAPPTPDSAWAEAVATGKHGLNMSFLPASPCMPPTPPHTASHATTPCQSSWPGGLNIPGGMEDDDVSQLALDNGTPLSVIHEADEDAPSTRPPSGLIVARTTNTLDVSYSPSSMAYHGDASRSSSAYIDSQLSLVHRPAAPTPSAKRTYTLTLDADEFAEFAAFQAAKRARGGFDVSCACGHFVSHRCTAPSRGGISP